MDLFFLEAMQRMQTCPELSQLEDGGRHRTGDRCLTGESAAGTGCSWTRASKETTAVFAEGENQT